MGQPRSDLLRDGPAIVAEDLHKRFGRIDALRGLDLTVIKGSVSGLLGPNGAGKTTVIRILATLAGPDAGRARVAGFDVVRQADEVRGSIGLAGQHVALEEGISGRENLCLIGWLYHLGRRRARQRADELLDRFGLTEAADRLVRTYSGGMRRRLDLIASLVIRRAVLFLDEPTTGLDPRSRNAIWQTIRELAADGTTVLLTTQNLDEADRLADDIAVVDAGRVIASGPPQRLKAMIGARVEVTLADASQLDAAVAVLASLAGAKPVTDPAEYTVSVTVDPHRTVALPRLVRELDGAGVSALDVATRQPSLDDVFLALTGHVARQAGPGHADVKGAGR